MRAMLPRREFCRSVFSFAVGTVFPRIEPFNLAAFDRKRVLAAATRYLGEQPITVTASSSGRSAGGKHDFFSEGDYWWPDSRNPGGPYIQRDGMSNPDNFVDHPGYLVLQPFPVPALAAPGRITRKKQFAAPRARHLTAGFLE